jgi:hypothetical protein
MSDHDSLSPLLVSLTSAFTKSRRPGAPQTGSVDRALGAAASLGLSLAILRLVVFCAKAAKRLESSDDPNQLSSLESAGNVWYAFMRNLIRRMLQEDDASPKDSKGSAGMEGDGAMITHQGSCHCESIHFEVRKIGLIRSSIVFFSIFPFLYCTRALCFPPLYSSFLLSGARSTMSYGSGWTWKNSVPTHAGQGRQLSSYQGKGLLENVLCSSQRLHSQFQGRSRVLRTMWSSYSVCP